jgi:hypothetical protein
MKQGLQRLTQWRKLAIILSISMGVSSALPVMAATTTRLTPYTGDYLQGDWSWEPKDTVSAYVWPTSQPPTASNIKTIPWWNILLLQQSGQNMGTLVQYILNYMGQLKLKEAEQQAMVAPSTALDNNVSGRNIVTMPASKDLSAMPLPLNNAFAIHQQFCSLSDTKAGICAPNAVNTANPNADLTASSLLSHDVLATAQAQVAAKGYLQQLFSAKIIQAPLQLTDKGQLKPDAVNKLRMQWSTMARQSLAETIFNRMLEERMPVRGLWMPGASSGPDISLKELMRHEANWRFESQTWKNQVNTAPNNALLRELVNMEAYRMYLEYQQNQKLEDISMLLAVTAAGASGTGVNDVMKSALSQASAAAVHSTQ